MLVNLGPPFQDSEKVCPMTMFSSSLVSLWWMGLIFLCRCQGSFYHMSKTPSKETSLLTKILELMSSNATTCSNTTSSCKIHWLLLHHVRNTPITKWMSFYLGGLNLEWWMGFGVNYVSRWTDMLHTGQIAIQTQGVISSNKFVMKSKQMWLLTVVTPGHSIFKMNWFCWRAWERYFANAYLFVTHVWAICNLHHAVNMENQFNSVSSLLPLQVMSQRWWHKEFRIVVHLSVSIMRRQRSFLSWR